METASRDRWQALHRGSSGLVAAVAFVHCAMTAVIYDAWGPDALWFLGSGLALLLLSVLNLAHAGVGRDEPGRDPAATVLKWANWAFLVFGLAALAAVPEPQALVIVLGLGGQALAGSRTLRGRAGMPKDR